jgi:hypothetical protein
MVELQLSIEFVLGGRDRPAPQKKTDVVEHPQVFDHVGLLVNGPPGRAELPFI